MTGTESIHAEQTPVSVFVPPGPVVIKQQQRLLFEIFTGQTTEKNAKKFINRFIF